MNISKLIFIVGFLISETVTRKKETCEPKYKSNIYTGGANGTEYKLVTLKLAETGNKVTLFCGFCHDSRKSGDVVWKRKEFLSKVVKEVKIGTSKGDLNNRFTLGKAMSLVIRSVKTEDSGYYYCLDRDKGEAQRIAYLLDVQADSGVAPVVGNEKDLEAYLEQYIKPMNASLHSNIYSVSSSKTENATALDTTKYTLAVSWNDWSTCKPCGTPNGVRQRVGQCRLYEKVPLMIEDNYVELPQPSVGCHSQLLKAVPKLSEQLYRIPNFIKEEPCQEKCPKKFLGGSKITAHKKRGFKFIQKWKERRDKLKEKLGVGWRKKNYTASPVIKPLRAPLVIIKEFEGSKLRLKCPQTTAKEAPDWYFNYHLLDPKLTTLQTSGRVTIDSRTYNLVFKRLKPSDSGVYTCVTQFLQRGNMELQVGSYVSPFDPRSPFGAMRCTTIGCTLVFAFLVASKIKYQRNIMSANKYSKI